MKKLLLPTLIILFAFFIPFAGCKKYDDGPIFSLRSKDARVAGNWDFKSYTNNGTDYTQLFLGCQWEFTKDGGFKEIFAGDIATGTWEFGSNKEAIDVTIDGDIMRLKIKRLTNNEMWLELNDVGDISEIKLTSK